MRIIITGEWGKRACSLEILTSVKGTYAVELSENDHYATNKSTIKTETFINDKRS